MSNTAESERSGLLSVSEASSRYELSLSWIYRRIAGRLIAVELDGYYYLDPEELEDQQSREVGR